MLSISNYLYQVGSGILSYLFPKEEDTMQQLPHFGESEWQALAGLNVEAPEIPQHLLDASKNIDPFWTQYTIDQTHVLCCIPAGISTAKLYDIAGKSTSFLEESDHNVNSASYWCWVSKKAVLNHFSPEMQQKKLSEMGRDAPTTLEAMVAIFFVKNLGNSIIYPDHERATRCKKTSNSSLDNIVGGDSKATFCSYAKSWQSVGVASVLR